MLALVLYIPVLAVICSLIFGVTVLQMPVEPGREVSYILIDGLMRLSSLFLLIFLAPILLLSGRIFFTIILGLLSALVIGYFLQEVNVLIKITLFLVCYPAIYQFLGNKIIREKLGFVGGSEAYEKDAPIMRMMRHRIR